jgi:hypothetical protein
MALFDHRTEQLPVRLWGASEKRCAKKINQGGHPKKEN